MYLGGPLTFLLPAAGGLRPARWAWRASARRTPCTMWRHGRGPVRHRRGVRPGGDHRAASRHYSSSHSYQSSAALFHDEEEYQEFPLPPPEGQRPDRRPLAEDTRPGLRRHRRRLHHGKGRGGQLRGARLSSPATCPTPATRCPWCGISSRSSTRNTRTSSIRVLRLHRLRRGDYQKRLSAWTMGVVETVAHFTAAKKFDAQTWTSSSTSAARTSSASKLKTAPSTTSSSTRRAPPAAAAFCRPSPGALGYEMADFAKLGLFADSPVDLGSRCTVFMNSSVKQAQKDGASIENISAGLSISVVKNALYKVIRVVDARSLGDHIVVQGGTFLNDAVLRAFEKEIGKYVIRPSVSGLMGAYGAALYSKEKGRGHSTILGAQELENFTHQVKAITCNGCQNHCRLTVNTFANGARYIAGNRCDKPLQNGEPHRPVQPVRLQTGAAGLLQALHRPPGHHRHPHGPEYVRAATPSGTPSSPSWALGCSTRRQCDRKLYFQWPAHHPLGHGVLPGQADARPHRGPAGSEARTPSSTPA